MHMSRVRSAVRVGTLVTATEDPQITAARQFAADLETRRWSGGVRVIFQGSMRAVMRDGSMDLQSGWQAEVFIDPKQRKPSFVFVAETPQKLLNDLAALVSGEVYP